MCSAGRTWAIHVTFTNIVAHVHATMSARERERVERDVAVAQAMLDAAAHDTGLTGTRGFWARVRGALRASRAELARMNVDATPAGTRGHKGAPG